MADLAYSLERSFPVPVVRLWQAWTNAQELEAWYCPVSMRVKPGSTVSELTPGGEWKTAVEAPENAGTAYFWGRYGEIHPTTRIEHTMFYSVEESDFLEASEQGPSHLVVLDFEERDGGSWVRYSQFGEMPPEMAEGARQGMESYFDSLEQHLKSA